MYFEYSLQIEIVIRENGRRNSQTSSNDYTDIQIGHISGGDQTGAFSKTSQFQFHEFAQCYPQSSIIVTSSHLVAYNPNATIIEIITTHIHLHAPLHLL